MVAVIALLDCGHYVEYGSSTPVANPTGPQEECPECNDTKLIITEWREQWNAVCNKYPCTFKSHHGWNRKGAERSAGDHRRTTGHGVTVGYFSYAPPDAKREVRARRRSRLPNSLPPNVPPPF